MSVQFTLRVPTALALVLGIGIVLSPPAFAADEDVVAMGKQRFMESCAVCHGAEGKGGGPFANVLNKAPSDLTMLSKANDGDFPWSRVYDMIDGREMPRAHGTAEMPIWGVEWRAKSTMGSETELRGRILEMIVYLRSIQQ